MLYDKKNNPWNISRLECFNGSYVELFTFSDTYIKYKDYFKNDNIIYVEGEPSRQNNDDANKIITKRILNIENIRNQFSNNINIKLDFNLNNKDIIIQLYETATKFPGKCKLVIHVVSNKGNIQKINADEIFVSNKQEAIDQFRSKVGSKNVWIS